MQRAKAPCGFLTACSPTEIRSLVATNLAHLRDGLEKGTAASVFCHTFRSPGRHRFPTERFSHDFAPWVLGACNLAVRKQDPRRPAFEPFRFSATPWRERPIRSASCSRIPRPPENPMKTATSMSGNTF